MLPERLIECGGIRNRWCKRAYRLIHMQKVRGVLFLGLGLIDNPGCAIALAFMANDRLRMSPEKLEEQFDEGFKVFGEPAYQRAQG